MQFKLSSAAFPPNGTIPEAHTCDGPDRPPPLKWSGAPDGTKSFALIVDDPDAPDPKAPKTTYVHWVLYDVPPSVSSLGDGAARRRPARARDSMIGSVEATTVRVRRSDAIDTSSSSTRSTPFLETLARRRKPTSKPQCAVTCWRMRS
jgi:phosphatidylethanolamine-binding protein (PEBP) family uncharacterized protein